MFVRFAFIALTTLMVTFSIGVITAAPAAAQIAEEDRALALDDAFARLKSAATAEDAEAAEAEVWTLWNIGPDGVSTAMLAQATVMLRRGLLNDAHIMLDALVAKHPNYIEAWNQRAFAKFLKGEVHASLTDIDQVLKREPRHFGALAGRARIEASLGRMERAMKTMGEVGQVHPWMARRSAIPAFPPVPEPGEKL